MDTTYVGMVGDGIHDRKVSDVTVVVKVIIFHIVTKSISIFSIFWGERSKPVVCSGQSCKVTKYKYLSMVLKYVLATLYFLKSTQ